MPTRSNALTSLRSLRAPDALAPALAADALAVLVFVAVGRASHAETRPVLGVLVTAWPFLVGLLAGWALSLLRGRAVPVAVRRGIPLWASTVVVGMLLRVATGRGMAPSFVVVAAVVLGAFLLGWRGVAALARRRRERR